MIKEGNFMQCFAPETTTTRCVNQPRVNHLRGFVLVIEMPVEHILGRGANTSYIIQTQLTHSQPWQLDRVWGSGQRQTQWPALKRCDKNQPRRPGCGENTELMLCLICMSTGGNCCPEYNIIQSLSIPLAQQCFFHKGRFMHLTEEEEKKGQYHE